MSTSAGAAAAGAGSLDWVTLASARGESGTDTVQSQAPPLGGELILQTPDLQTEETRWGEVSRDAAATDCVPGTVGIIWASQPSLTTPL